MSAMFESFFWLTFAIAIVLLKTAWSCSCEPGGSECFIYLRMASWCLKMCVEQFDAEAWKYFPCRK